jgi:hypothetical protein
MSDNLNQLLAYPIVDNIEYRSNINSKDLNLMFKSIEESVLRALIKGAEVESKIKTLNLASNSAYTALGIQNQVYNDYPKPQTIPSGEYGGVAFCSAFGEISGVRQDQVGGIVTMNWNNNKKLSKIPVYNGVVSPNVQIYVDDILRPVGDPVYSILDGDKSTFWVEQTTSGSHTLELVLPPSTQKTFNYIEIYPFPIFGIEITKIEYYDLQSIKQTIYPSVDTNFYNKCGPLILHLAPREFNNTIKITYNVINGIDAMGFTSIDICSIDYLDTTNTVYLKFENIPEKNYLGNTLTSIRPVSISLDFYVDGVLKKNGDEYDSYITEIKLVTSPDVPTGSINIKRLRDEQTLNISNSSLLTVTQSDGSPNACYLKVVMNEVNLTTPVVRGAKLNYREV